MLIRPKRCHERAKLWKLNTYAAKEVGKWTVEIEIHLEDKFFGVENRFWISRLTAKPDF